ncbi:MULTISPECIES: hypothetical protein [Paenibacillus]|uniref:hypothetical protein n=1 Tax=Paenibacillus TaxID=44249 RepID=UPI0022B8F061|nr:hypothetical protein [Paenibacillus caseinilyticus]MCZ8521218.1 hypothetical protein [Paenibacillus caseinilyticus]
MTDWNQINILEEANQDKQAFLLLKKAWTESGPNLPLAVRLGFLCWYALVEWGCSKPADAAEEDYDSFESTLQEVTKQGMRCFAGDPGFLWFFGYAITLFPYHFGDYEEWHAIGSRMLLQAHRLRPHDPFIEMLYWGSQPSSSAAYAVARSKAALTAKERFAGGGRFQRYFLDLVCRM